MGVSRSQQEHTTPDSRPLGTFSLLPGGLWATHAEAELDSLCWELPALEKHRELELRRRLNASVSSYLTIPWRLFSSYTLLAASRNSGLICKFVLRSRVWAAMWKKRVYRCPRQILPFPMALSLHSSSLFGFCFLTWCNNWGHGVPQPSFCILPFSFRLDTPEFL